MIKRLLGESTPLLQGEGAGGEVIKVTTQAGGEVIKVTTQAGGEVINATDPAGVQFSPKSAILLLLVIMLSHCACAQWIASYTAIPPIVGSAWFKFGFATPDSGYLVHNEYFSVSTGYTYHISKTINGGVTWTPAQVSGTSIHPESDFPGFSPGSYVTDIAVPHRDTVFYTSYGFYGMLIRMASSGGTTGYMIPGIPGDLAAVNPHEVFVLYKGYSLENASLSFFNGDTVHTVYQCDTLNAGINSRLHFVNSSTGFILVNNLAGEVVMLKTTIGGAGFTYVNLPSGVSVTALWFISPVSGFIGCSNGSIYRTDDQGSTWQLLNTGSSFSVNSIHFINDTVGMVCGSNGGAILTTDGGQTWNPRNCSGNLTTIRVFSPTQAYTCNNNYFPIFYKGIYPVCSPDRAEDKPAVYPNPFKDQLFIKLPQGVSELPRFEIISISGKLVRNGILPASRTLDLELLPPGTYCIKLIFPGSVFVSKIFK
jgi:hypothetical protein